MTAVIVPALLAVHHIDFSVNSAPFSQTIFIYTSVNVRRGFLRIRTTETKPNPDPNTHCNPNPNSTDLTKPYHLTVYSVRGR